MTYNILLVEDTDNDYLVMTHIIETIMGHRVVIARDGLEAVATAKQTACDLVLLDLGLPKLHGWDVAEAIQQESAYRSVPIIVVTAYDHPGTRERCVKAGCKEYLVKPVDVDHLIGCNHKALTILTQTLISGHCRLIERQNHLERTPLPDLTPDMDGTIH